MYQVKPKVQGTMVPSVPPKQSENSLQQCPVAVGASVSPVLSALVWDGAQDEKSGCTWLSQLVGMSFSKHLEKEGWEGGKEAGGSFSLRTSFSWPLHPWGLCSSSGCSRLGSS